MYQSVKYSYRLGKIDAFRFTLPIVDDPDLVTRSSDIINKAESIGERSISFSMMPMYEGLEYMPEVKNALATFRSEMKSLYDQHKAVYAESKKRYFARKEALATPITKAAGKIVAETTVRAEYTGEPTIDVLEDVIRSSGILESDTDFSLTELGGNVKAVVAVADATRVEESDAVAILNLTSSKTQEKIGGQLYDVYTDDPFKMVAGYIPESLKKPSTSLLIILGLAFILLTFTRG